MEPVIRLLYFIYTVTYLPISDLKYPMGRLHKKESSFCLFESYLDNEVVNNREYPELFHVRFVGSAIPRRITNDDFEYPDMDINDKDVTNVQLEDHGLSEDDITLCTVTMLGVVMQWQPRVEDVKEVCLKAPHDYSITAAIYDSCTTRDRYSYSLLNIWASQLLALGFWPNEKKYYRTNSLKFYNKETSLKRA